MLTVELCILTIKRTIYRSKCIETGLLIGRDSYRLILNEYYNHVPFHVTNELILIG